MDEHEKNFTVPLVLIFIDRDVMVFRARAISEREWNRQA
jgi:hypothetical protein